MASASALEPLTGSCFCGAVSYTLAREPVLRGYCHCTICQRLTGCPFVHTIHFEQAAFTWTHVSPSATTVAADPLAALDSYTIPLKPWKTRFRCRACGVCVASRNARTGHVSVWGAHLARDEEGRVREWERVRPTAHIFYETRMLDVEDGLGKWEGYEGLSERIG